MKDIWSELVKITSGSYVRIGIGILVSVLSLYFALRNVDLAAVWSSIMQANVFYVGLAVLSGIAGAWAKGIRWKILIGSNGNHIPFLTIFGSHVAGQMLNLLFPARLGDVSRAYVVGGMGPGRTFVLGTVVLEKFLDMVSYALLFFLLLVLMPLPPWISDSGIAFSIVTLLCIATVIFMIRQRDLFLNILERIIVWLPEQFQQKTSSRLQSGLSSLDILEQRTDRYRLIAWTACIWMIAVLNNYVVLLALDMSLSQSLIASMVVLAVLQIGISLPSAPAKIGVFEYGCVVALALFGVEQAPAFSYGVLLHAIVMLPLIFGGAIFLVGIGTYGKRVSVHK